MRHASLLVVLLMGCSSSDFEVAESADTGGLADDTGTIAADTDSPVDDIGTVVDSGTTADAQPEVPVVCAELAANPAVVYVDKRSTRATKGTAECPFTTIKDAIAFINGLPSGSGKHQVRVAGGAIGSPVVYEEPTLVLKWQTTVTGDGMGRVVITGGGACGEGTCMIVMEGGTTLEGVSLDAKGLAKVPLVMGPGFLTTALVRSTEITGTRDDKNPAVYVEGGGAAEVGPDVRIHDNGGHGILVKNIGALKVTSAGGTPNQLHRNLVGVQMIGGRLEMVGANEVYKSKVHGVVIITAERNNFIDGLVATENAGTAVYVDGGASLKLRRSKLLANDTGLFFRFNTTNELDLGTLLDPGGNTLGTKLITNKRMAICLPAGRTANAPARANYFGVCPPTAATMAEAVNACELVPPGAYKDIYFASNGTEPIPPFDLTSCGVK